MSKTTQLILDQTVLIKVEANIYGARKKLKREDLMLADGSRLPPEDLASLGSKRLLDPEQLAVFNRLKKEAERVCLRVGTRFMGGFMVPTSASSYVIKDLERIETEFGHAKQTFLQGYDQAVKDWIVKHPEFAAIIEQAVDSVELVATRLAFDFVVVSITVPKDLPDKSLHKLDSQIGSLSQQLFHEIAVDANLLLDQSLLGKDQVTRNALRPIRRMRDKLDGLGFLDHRVGPVVSTLDDLLNRIPVRGAIEGSILQEIMATAMLLADPDKTLRHGEGLLAVHQALRDLPARVALQAQGANNPLNPSGVDLTQSGEMRPDDPFNDLFAGILEDEPETEDEKGLVQGLAEPAVIPSHEGWF